MIKLIKLNALILSLLISVTASAEPSVSLISALKPWQPEAVSVQENRLIIVTKESRVTKTIYEAIITNGICTPIWLGMTEHIQSKEIAVLNNFQKQGYVFEEPEITCVAMGKLRENEALKILMGNSRMY